MAEQNTLDVAEQLEDPGAVDEGAKFLGGPVPQPQTTAPETREQDDKVAQAIAAATAQEREIWGIAGMPAEQFDELDPESRRIALKVEFATKRSGETQPQGSTSETGTETANPDAPPVPVLPNFDGKAIVGDVAKAFADQDEDAFSAGLNKFAQVINDLVKYSDESMKVVAAALEMQDKGIGALSRPAQLRATLPKVKHANDGDVAAADVLLASGRAQTALDALYLAVSERFDRDGLPQQGQAGETPAQRLARAKASVNASNLNTGGVTTQSHKHIGETGGNWSSQAGRDLVTDLDNGV